MKKYIIISLVAIAVVCSLLVINYVKRVSNYKDKINNIVIQDVKLDNKEDGIYIGEFDADMIAVKVEIEVKNKRISNINLIQHKNEKGAPAEVITQKVMDAQSLKVDVISGATNSSKVILKAIENALSKGKIWVIIKGNLKIGGRKKENGRWNCNYKSLPLFFLVSYVDTYLNPMLFNMSYI